MGDPLYIIIYPRQIKYIELLISVQNTGGKEFIIVFMENIVENNRNPDLEVFVTSSKDVMATVSSPKYTEPWAPFETKTIPAHTVGKYNIDYRLKLSDDALETKAILINATDEINVYGVNTEAFSSDGFLAIPTDSLGKEHYTISYTPATTNCVIGLAGIEDGTRVTIRFPDGDDIDGIEFRGRTYRNGDTITVTLDRFDTLQLRSKGDLTGTRVIATRPIAVFSGNVRTSTDNKKSRDHLVEQIPPITTWGRQFLTIPIPGRTPAAGGDYIRILASADNTEVFIEGEDNLPDYQKNFTLNKAGEFRQISVGSNSPLKIMSDKGILVVQIAKSEVTNTEDRGDPAMIIIPPIEQYDSDYSFLTPSYSGASDITTKFENTLLIAVPDSAKDGLIFDGEPLSLDWQPVPSTSYVTGVLSNVSSFMSHDVYHKDGIPFMGILYGYADRETYGFPVGMRLSAIGNVSCASIHLT